MITNENKKRILEAIATNRTNYPSDAKHAASLGIRGQRIFPVGNTIC